MKYIKKRIVVEAFRYGFDKIPLWFNVNLHTEHTPVQRDFETGETVTLPKFAMIQTLEGAMKADLGDYIIKGIKGELYPCKAHIFDQLYDKCTDDE